MSTNESNLRPRSLNPLPRHLPPVKTSEGSNRILVLAALDLNIAGCEEDLNVAGVALVWVDATVRTIGAAAGFLKDSKDVGRRYNALAGRRTYGSLLHDDILDDQVLQVKTLGIRVGLGVLQEAKEKLDRLLRPPTWKESLNIMKELQYVKATNLASCRTAAPDLSGQHRRRSDGRE